MSKTGSAQFLKSTGLFGIGMAPEPRLEPSGATKWTVAGKIWNGRQITTLSFRSVLHPRRIVLNVLTNLRPATYEMSGLHVPMISLQRTSPYHNPFDKNWHVSIKFTTAHHPNGGLLRLTEMSPSQIWGAPRASMERARAAGAF